MDISDIGSTNSTGLHCHTNYSDPHSRGDWIAPDGTRISSGSVPGFRITSSPKLVRLLRKSGTPQQGIYHCVVENATAIIHTVNIGLYNSAEGIFSQKHTHTHKNLCSVLPRMDIVVAKINVAQLP